MILALVLLLAVVLVVVFYITYLPFGGRSDAASWLKSKNFNGKLFVNQVATSMGIGGRETMSLLKEMWFGEGKELRQPKQPIQPEPVDIQAFLAATTPQLIWLGHSTVLLRVDGKTIITDPILSMRSSPFSFAGPKRTISRIPITAEELPPIDAVVISHDHYDHLDYETIRKIHAKTTKFFVPLGVAAHLRKWGVAADKIIELDWWDESKFEDFTLTCTPARHFSGRKLGDRFKTLWASWVIQAPSAKIYFSGDSAYGPHYAQIGEKYGPFDLTLMECGQYNQAWSTVHMMPEETVRAHQDLRGKQLFLVHWYAFVLALHPWDEPGKRAEAAVQKTDIRLIRTKLGAMHSFMEDSV